MSQDEQVTYADFLYTCRTNGLLYAVVGRMGFFDLSASCTLPCRSIEDGRRLINDIKSDGEEGYFYIRKLSVPHDPWYDKLKNWILRYR